ncbi:MAG: mechanosensitive ion channel family protein [Defluviitaleaceae bacterium]|nr:mechanosensitive ion channel family protein [Defluviitaleaceae bacterium]
MQDLLHSTSYIWITARVTLTLLATILAIKTFRIIWRRYSKGTIHQKFIKNVLSILIWLIGILVALNWLPNFSDAATAVLAGSGLVVLTIGLAAQESLGNAFSGLFISMFKPFEVGDRVHLTNADITGFIEDITIRHTVLRTFMNSRIIIPNSVMNKELIENANFVNPQASNFIDVTITYDSNVTIACEIIADTIGNHPDFVDTRTQQSANKVPVFVRALGLYGIELRASMWTATIANNFAACSDVRKGILQEFEKADIRIASSKIIDALIQQ